VIGHIPLTQAQLSLAALLLQYSRSHFRNGTGTPSPILLKNSDLALTRNLSCPLNRIAHFRHEGISAYFENLAQEPRSAFAPASIAVAPLQIQIAEN
jgi:hypothetical protein